MGKLIKNHWARLIILVAAAYQVLAATQAFFWPKLFFDFLTTNLDPCVRPIPILQIVNLLLGLFGVCLEWPLPIFVAASKALRPPRDRCQQSGAEAPVKNPSRLTVILAALHRSIEARLFIYPLSSLAALLLYQGTNAGLYYLIGMGVYFWAFSEGEVIMGVPWTLPRRLVRRVEHV